MTIDEQLEGIARNLELMMHQLDVLAKFVAQDTENIRGLARIVERSLTALEGGQRHDN